MNFLIFLKKIKAVWMRFARMLGWLNSMILLTIVYIFILGPIALVLKMFRRDLLQKKKETAAVSYWQKKRVGTVSLNEFKHQF